MNQHGSVVAFAGDRPGVGQTMALSSTALILAANGYRVLTIDGDFAKPSIAQYFAPLLPTEVFERDGLIDVVWEYAAAARRTSPMDLPTLPRRFSALSPTECAIPSELRVLGSGTLDFVSAGREPRRGVRAHYFSWGEFYDRLDGTHLLTALFEEFKRCYDYVLVDCAQGFEARDSVILHADTLVPCFTLARENARATAAIVHGLVERAAGRSLRISPLPLRVQHAEKDLLERAREAALVAFRALNDVAIVSENWSHTAVPEVPWYTYQRALPPLSSDQGMVEAYRQLARALTGRPEIGWKPPGDRHRTRYLAEYERTTDRGSTPQTPRFRPPYSGDERYAFVSYARDDKDRVMPVLQELIDLGSHLWWDEEIPAGSDWHSYLRGRIGRAHYLLAFLSGRSVRSRWTAEEIRLANELGKPILSVRLDWSEAPKDVQDILDRYQILDRAAEDFREQLGRGIHLLDANE